MSKSRKEWRKRYKKRERREKRLRKKQTNRLRRQIVLTYLLLVILTASVTGTVFFFINQRIKEEIEVELPKVENVATVDAPTEPTESEQENSQSENYEIVEELIAEHTIYNSKSQKDKARNHNMFRAAEIINGDTEGYILEPGEKFSWLEIVGDPTEERGFEKAGVIVNRKPTKGWGGGVCQVSSAIYSAISKTEQATDKEHLFALEHSLKSAYINPENGDKEATVTFSGKKDFWFVSTLEYSIRIYIETGEGTATVKIFSRKKEIPN